MKNKSFSILIPTWNNLAYLRKCVESIQKHSSFHHQIIIHINEGNDDTEAWVQENKIAYTYSPDNIGICRAVNQSFQLAINDYIVYMNDDMYVCPKWDEYLLEEIEKAGTDKFMLSSTMIEHRYTGNDCVIVANYGDSVESFQEEKLLSEYHTFSKKDWSGSMWPPCVIHRSYWEKIGGFSEEFSPGMYSDPDFAMKMWQAGCRYFKGVSKSRVYHFQAKSTGKVRKNNGRKQFIQKWKLLPSAFGKYYLRRGQDFKTYQNANKSLGYYWSLLRSSILLIVQKNH